MVVENISERRAISASSSSHPVRGFLSFVLFFFCRSPPFAYITTHRKPPTAHHPSPFDPLRNCLFSFRFASRWRWRWLCANDSNMATIFISQDSRLRPKGNPTFLASFVIVIIIMLGWWWRWQSQSQSQWRWWWCPVPSTGCGVPRLIESEM